MLLRHVEIEGEADDAVGEQEHNPFEPVGLAWRAQSTEKKVAVWGGWERHRRGMWTAERRG